MKKGEKMKMRQKKSIKRGKNESERGKKLNWEKKLKKEERGKIKGREIIQSEKQIIAQKK